MSSSSITSLKKIAKDTNKMSRAFPTVSTQLQNLKEADSDLYDSEDEYETSHFNMAKINFGKSDFQFAHLDEEFNSHIASIFNHIYGRNFGIKIKPNLREVTLSGHLFNA